MARSRPGVWTKGQLDLARRSTKRAPLNTPRFLIALATTLLSFHRPDRPLRAAKPKRRRRRRKKSATPALPAAPTLPALAPVDDSPRAA